MNTIVQPSQPSPMQSSQLSSTPLSSPKGKKASNASDNSTAKTSKRAAVASWCSQINAARKKQKCVFEEMRSAMKFAAGYQWPGQKDRNDKRYTANFSLREVNKKVAALYARNPTAEYQRRPRLDFALYDGKLEDLVPLLQQAQVHPMGLAGLPMHSQALLADYQHGMQQRQLIDRVGKTLQILFQQQLDEQDEEEGEFKLQMKQLVRRTIISKVGYVRVAFVRDGDAHITSSGVGNTIMNRGKQIAYMAEKVQDGKIDESSAQYQVFKSLAVGLGGVLQDRIAEGNINERLVFDCLPSTSIILDPRCRQLKGFIGARWIAVEYCLPVEDVNALFEVDINASQVKSKQTDRQMGIEAKAHEKGQETCHIWEVLNKADRTHFFICDGYQDYLMEPEPLEPSIRGFWPIAALTFNDIEADDEAGIGPFPPSDVELIMSPQREWNRSRNALTKHRKANEPGWMAPKGLLTEEDKESLENGAINQVIELTGPTSGMDIAKVFIPRPKIPIEPAVYDTAPQAQDVTLTIGAQPEQPIPGQPTATGQTIAEQSRMTVTSSNVDDLDDLLTWIAKASAQLMLQEFSLETVQRLVGEGAAWPQMPADRAFYLSQIYLVTQAASSGRPNKATDMANWRIAAPVLQAAGANPQFMVRETLRRLDDNLDPEQAFPLIPMTLPPGQLPGGGQHQPAQQDAHIPGHNLPPQQGRPGPSPQPDHQNLHQPPAGAMQ